MSTHTYSEDKRLVQELCDIEEGLTPWEVNFVESISSQVMDDGKTLSERQRITAETILRKDR